MRSSVLLAIVWVFCGLFTAHAEDNGKAAGEDQRAPEELRLTTERVIVFKDGYCLVVKRGEATANAAGEVFTGTVPDAAILGSFWAVPAKGRLLSMDAGVVTVTEKTTTKTPCTDHLSLLKSNEGKACSVVLNDAEKTTYAGTILSVLTTQTEQPLPESGTPGWVVQPQDYRSSRLSTVMPATLSTFASVATLSGSIFVLRTEAGDVAIPVAQVRTLTLKDMVLEAERVETVKKTAKRLTFRFEKGGERKELLLMYFTPGLRWIPSYRVELAAEDAEQKVARIALQAELLNEVEDLTDVPVDIVVGVPNFRFKNVISPFALEAGLRNALVQAAPQLMNQFRNDQMSNALVSQRVGEWQRDGGPMEQPDAGALQLPPELTATGAQDLFVYHLPRLTLAKGHRAAVPIFDTTAPYREVYTWNLHVQRHDIEAAPSGQGIASPLVLSQNQVWHQLELDNTSALPWTTGAVMVLQGAQPLAQELLTYTSARDSVRIPLTVSVDTRGTFSEEETGRDLKALRFDNCDYAKIAKEAHLVLRNLKKVAIPVEITCQIGGKAEQASLEGRIALSPFSSSDWQNYRSHPAVNNHSTIFWRVQIEPGQSFAPTVKYSYFTRN